MHSREMTPATDHFSTEINADDKALLPDDLFQLRGHFPRPTSEINDPLAGLGIQQLQNSGSI